MLSHLYKSSLNTPPVPAIKLVSATFSGITSLMNEKQNPTNLLGMLSNGDYFEELFGIFSNVVSGVLFILVLVISTPSVNLYTIRTFLETLYETQPNILFYGTTLLILYIIGGFPSILFDSIWWLLRKSILKIYSIKKRGNLFKIIHKLAENLTTALIVDPLIKDSYATNSSSKYLEYMRKKLCDYFEFPTLKPTELYRLSLIATKKGETTIKFYRTNHIFKLNKTLVVSLMILGYSHIFSITTNIFLFFIALFLFSRLVEETIAVRQRVLDEMYLQVIKKNNI